VTKLASHNNKDARS